MPRETDRFREYVEPLDNNRWKCNFCGNDYRGSATRIKAHLAGVGGYGIHGCKVVTGGVRSEARKALKDKGPGESSNESEGNVQRSSYPRLINPSLTQGSHPPVTVSNEDAWRETSFAAMPNLSSDAISTIVASSSAFLPLNETDVPSQYLPAQNMISQRDFSFWTQPPQSHAGDSNIQPQNLSYPRSGRDLAPEALTNMPRQENAEEGEPNTEVPQGKMLRVTDPFWKHVAPKKKWKCKFCRNEYAGGATRIKAHFAGVGGYGIVGCRVVDDRVRSEALMALNDNRAVELSKRRGNVEDDPHQCMIASNEAETNLPDPSLLAELMITQMDLSFYPQPSQNPTPLNAEEGEPNIDVPQGEMPRVTDPFWKHVVSKKKWECRFCRNEYAGGATRIKAHFAGVGGYGIVGCRAVDDRVRSEALMALNDNRAVELSNRQGIVEEGPHQMDFSFCPQPSQNPTPLNAEEGEPNIEVQQGAYSSAFLPLPETNLSNPSILAELVIPEMDFSFCSQLPQNMIPLNAKEGEPNIEVLQGASSSTFLPLLETNLPNPSLLVELMIPEMDFSFCSQPPQNTIPLNAEGGEPNMEVLQGATSSAFLPLPEMNLPNPSLPAELMITDMDFSFGPQPPQDMILLSAEEGEPNIEVPQGCRQRSRLVTTKLVGNDSENGITMICDYLTKDEISIIGVYGMGGVGKTAILMHVHNRVLEDPAFNDVLWVTVPRNFSVYELQDEIANAAGLDNISKDKDVKRRASMLNIHLKKKKRSVLILDGMLMPFAVMDVGIPFDKGDFKLVLTTQSLDVCRKMLCQKQIKIELLDWPNSWSLFSENLCFGGELPPVVEAIAKSIVEKCGGLPLGIIEIATRMRGVEEVLEWMVMWYRLNNSQIELDLFKRLKLSYENLADPQVQQCFLHFVLCFGEDLSKTNKKDLIESFIDEGLLGGIVTRQNLHHQGEIILNKISQACLWDDREEESQYLHPLIRGMVLRMVMSPTHMVNDHMRLEEIPEENFWTTSLEKVYLQGNEIGEIHPISPNCSKLTRLSLNDNVTLGAIHESFFRLLNGLKVLDLSNTGIWELPGSICHLESLEALLLRRCRALRYIPYVGKLGSLRKLNLQGCASLEEVPKGMEMLVKLTYLDLGGTKIETLPEGVLEKLVNLQYLTIKKVRVGEEGKLKKVEELYCSVPNVETFNACVRFLEQNGSREYLLALNTLEDMLELESTKRHIVIGGCDNIMARVDEGIGRDDYALLPEDVQVLEVGGCRRVTSLCEVGPLRNLIALRIDEWEKLEEMGAVHFPKLVVLKINRCYKLKHLLKEGHCLPHLRFITIEGSEELEGINVAAPILQHIVVWECPKMKRVVEWEWLANRLPNLQIIKMKNCEKLEEIIGGPVPSSGTCCLKELDINGCNNMKGVLLTHDMLLHLPFLRNITVENCKSIEVIIGTASNQTPSSFPYLMKLTLWNLPELKSICDRTMSCDSIEWIDVKGCPYLKSIPLQLPLLDNGLPTHPPYLRKIKIDNRQTWESLEWDHPLAPSSLIHFLRFYDLDEESSSDSGSDDEDL